MFHGARGQERIEGAQRAATLSAERSPADLERRAIQFPDIETGGPAADPSQRATDFEPLRHRV